MPAANNLQDGNLTDKQGLIGKSLSTCTHHTTRNSTMCIPHLPRKRNCDYLISDPTAAATKNFSKRRKNPDMAQYFINLSTLKGLLSSLELRKICSRLKQTLHFFEKPTTTPAPFYTLCVILWQKSFFLLWSFVKMTGRSKWMFTAGYWIIQMLTTLQYIRGDSKILCHEQMSTLHTQLLQKRRIYHYQQILSWKGLFLLTFTTWRGLPKWSQDIPFKKNIIFSYFALSPINTCWNSPHSHASQFTLTASALP